MDFAQLDRQSLENSLEWEDSQEDTQYKAAKIKDLFPINYVEMKQKFFGENCKINPHFVYNTVVYPQVIPVHYQYQEIALKILQKATPYPSNLPYLTQSQVKKIIEDYCDNLGLKEYIQIKFDFQCLSRTSISFFSDRARLKIRTPLSYTTVNLEGVLNHQIGTHVIRTLNHKENCVRKPSHKGKIVEQGLAAINQLLPEPQPFLFKPALRYMAAIYASKMDFINVYAKLNKFLKDPQQCWRESVRVKRGLSNTEQKGGFYKDQNYLIGAVQILRNREAINFQKIYYGKLTAEQTQNLTDGVLPPFLGDEQKMKQYKKKLDLIALVNFID